MTKPNKKIVLGVVGAAAVGAAVYVLLTPGKGSDFRKKVADSASDIACRIGEYFTGAKEKLQTS